MRSTPVLEGGDPRLTELSAHSERFRALWGRHDVGARSSGVTVFDHPKAGRLELCYVKLAVLSAASPCPNCAAQYVIALQAEQSSVSADRLASWRRRWRAPVCDIR